MNRPENLIYIFGEETLIKKEAEIFEKVYLKLASRRGPFTPQLQNAIASRTREEVDKYYHASQIYVGDIKTKIREDPRILAKQGRLEVMKVDIVWG
ncbi:hypothetical protein KA107_02335 [Candidatus Pacearchaeota archaeon]|nr:hypothetical protein [Candidatus Pacearchaeota archaeon]